MTPYVSIDPAIQGGSPCLNHTRLTVQALASSVLGGYDNDAVIDCYPGTTVADIRLACWYAANYGLVVSAKRNREIQKAWRAWSEGDWKHTDPPKVMA